MARDGDTREERLAAALRANLRRRKAQTRARTETDGTGGTPDVPREGPGAPTAED